MPLQSREDHCAGVWIQGNACIGQELCVEGDLGPLASLLGGALLLKVRWFRSSPGRGMGEEVTWSPIAHARCPR